MGGMRYQPQAAARFRRNPLRRGLVGFWAPSGGGFISLIPGVPHATLVNGAVGVGPKGKRLNATGIRSATIADNARWKPTSAITVLAAGRLPSSSGYFFGCEQNGGNAGWGMYCGNGILNPYLRVGSSWAGVGGAPYGSTGLFGFSFDGNTFYSITNGQRDASQSIAGTITNSTNGLALNGANDVGDNGGQAAGDSQHDFLAIWDRALSPAELSSFYANPWQIIDDGSDDDDQPALAAPKQYTLTAAAGAFATTGVGAGLRVGRRMAATVASFALAGAGARLISSRRLGAGSAALSLSGAAVSLRAVRQLRASPGAFALTGSNVAMTYVPVQGPSGPTYTLTAASGVMGLTGAPAALRVQRRLQAASGGLLLNGSPARLLTARRISAQIGAFSVSGGAAALVYSASESVLDVSKISPYRVATFGGSGSRLAIFDGSGNRVAVFVGSGSRVSRFE